MAPMYTFRPSRLMAFLLAAWVVLGPGPASGHAIILAADPAVDALVHGPSIPVVLRFNSRLDHARSSLTLLRPDGSSMVIALKDTGRPDTLAATIIGLAPGSYRLRWQVLAVDGHITRGDIPFTVAP
jgi:methionine-rich copper-binding protein CopC